MRQSRVTLSASAAFGAALFMGMSTALAIGTVVVSPQNLNGWLAQYDGTASGSFVNGPGVPPAGTGSFRMGVGSDGDSSVLMRTNDFDGMQLAQLTDFTYATYVQQNNGAQAPYVIISVDTSGDGAADDHLFFEPAYQNGTYGTKSGAVIPNQCGANPNCVTLDAWQTWDVRNGGLWAISDADYGPPLISFNNYLLDHPTAIVATSTSGSIRVTAGGGAGAWDDFRGFMDDVQIGFVTNPTTTYDFEPVGTPDASGDLGIVKTGSGTVNRGGNAFYTVAVTNYAAQTATGVTVRDVIPAGVTYVPAQSDPACTATGGVVTCPDLLIGSGATRNLALAFAVPSTYPCGTPLVNTATVSGSTLDSDSMNDSSTSTRTVGCTAPASATLVVQPSNMQGWAFNLSGSGATGTGTFVRGPAVPPLGQGSVQFILGPDGDYVELRHGGYDGLLLADISDLSYSTYVPTGTGSSNDNTCQAPYLILTIDNNNDGDPDDNGDNILFYEPCYQSGAVVRDAWQNWDAHGGQWYPGYNDDGSGRVTGPPTQTLQQYAAAHPNARIVNSSNGRGGVRIDAGGGGAITSDDIYYADAYRIGFGTGSITTYDFEPDDRDGDGLNDSVDNCPLVPNANQSNVDGDALGDACDAVDNRPVVTPTDTNTNTGGGGGGGGGRRPPTNTTNNDDDDDGVAPPAFGGPGDGSFPDVESGSYYEDAVRLFLERGFLDDTQTRFRPNDASTRAELTKLVIELHGGILSAHPGSPSFDDVRPGTWYYEYMEEAGERTWVRGDANCYGRHPCTARPNDRVTRAEAAAIIVRTFDFEATNDAPRFSDVELGAWYRPWIQTAADHCVLQGDAGRTTVRPNDRVTRAELVVMLNRAYDNLSYDDGCRQVGTRDRMTSISLTSPDTLEVSFTGGIDSSSASDEDLFLLSCNNLRRDIVSTRRMTSTTVELTLDNDLPSGMDCRISVMNLEDEDGRSFNDTLLFRSRTASTSSSSRSSSRSSSSRTSSSSSSMSFSSSSSSL